MQSVQILQKYFGFLFSKIFLKFVPLLVAEDCFNSISCFSMPVRNCIF